MNREMKENIYKNDKNARGSRTNGHRNKINIVATK